MQHWNCSEPPSVSAAGDELVAGQSTGCDAVFAAAATPETAAAMPSAGPLPTAAAALQGCAAAGRPRPCSSSASWGNLQSETLRLSFVNV